MRFDELKRINLRQVTEIMPGNPFSLDDERYISYALDQAEKGSDLEKALSVLNEALSSREPLTLDDVCRITDSYRQIEFLCGKETENFTPELCKDMAEEYVKHIRSADSVIRILKNNISMVAGNGEMKLKKQEALKEYYEKRLALCREKAGTAEVTEEAEDIATETANEETDACSDDDPSGAVDTDLQEKTVISKAAVSEEVADNDAITTGILVIEKRSDSEDLPDDESVAPSEKGNNDEHFAEQSKEEIKGMTSDKNHVPAKAAETEALKAQVSADSLTEAVSDMMPETKQPPAVQTESLPQLPSGAAIPVFCEPFMNPYMQPYGVRYQQPITPVNVVINNNIGSQQADQKGK